MGSRRVDNIVVAGKSGAGKQPRIDVLVAELRGKILAGLGLAAEENAEKA